MTITKLFPDIERTYLGPAEYAEPRYCYLKRSARQESRKVRDVLESWYSRFPTDPDWLMRFRSKNDNSFISAFFELYIHELLTCLGYKVEIHPELNGRTGKKPDFYVYKNGEEGFYIEAVLASELSDEEAANVSRTNVVYDVINRLDTPDFFIGMRLRGAPESSPPGRDIRRRLADWLKGINYEQTLKIYEECGIEGLPKLNYLFEGWVIEFFPIPKGDKYRGKKGARPIGIQSFAARWIATNEVIKGAVKKKASRYGILNKPFVIAINSVSLSTSNSDILSALFGTEEYIYDLHAPIEQDPEVRRKPDGAWYGPKGPQNQRVSCIAIVSNLVPWSIAIKDIHLYHHPWATYPLNNSLGVLSNWKPFNNQMKFYSGLHPNFIFKLPPSWPEDEVAA
jgi:hypothetical protein